jgi:hypothetical protein
MPRGVHNSPRSFNTVDMTGRTFNRLTVIERAGTSADRKALWRCRCACGRETVVSGKDMRNGHIRSCGCILHEVTVARNTTHGTSGTRLYRIWKDMHKRCRHHPHYASRDISVDPVWDTYPPFRDWSLANGYRDDLTIDRKDTNAGYAPDNCRWATRKQQSENRYDRIGGYTPVP